jgi:hypothetical protein
MAKSSTVTSGATPVLQDGLAIWGVEMILVGGLASVIAWRARPNVVLGAGGALVALAAALGAALARSPWRPTARATVALCLSFASTVPGVLFFVDLLTRSGSARQCYDRPWFGAASAWLLLGPVLVVASATVVPPLRPRSLSLLVLRALHAVVWLIGAGNTALCALMV